jgi:hypothetical protein
MDTIVDAATSYPSAVFTVLLLVVIVYWLLALVGFVDFESTGLDLELELQGDTDPGELSTLAGYAVALGLQGVPFSIVITALVLVSWTLSCLISPWVLGDVSGLMLALGGSVVLLLCLAAALPLTGILVRPLRGLFVVHTAIGNANLVGQTCVVLSQRVDARFGRAAVQQPGTNIHIRVWIQPPHTLAKGDPAQIIAYDAQSGHYQVRGVAAAALAPPGH